MNKFTSLFVAFLFASFLISCESSKKKKADLKVKNQYLIGFYNTENLFDTIDNPEKLDEDFLPGSEKKWNSEKYFDKLEKLSSVLASADSLSLPDVFGLCEIENIDVIEDLINTEKLKENNYKIVHFETTDKRGIDNALVYNADFVSIIESDFIRLKTIDDNNIFSRDIVYAKSLLGTDTIHFFVNHWPSRRGGLQASEPKRIAFANILKHTTDSIMKITPNANIIIMGDFNDEPTNKSISEVLNAEPIDNDLKPNQLYNLSYKKHKDGIGSYHYWKDDVWNMLDQFIVSGTLIQNNSRLKVLNNDMFLNSKTEFLFKNSDGQMIPSKTYGKYYYGGYSDHLMVYIYLHKN